MSPTPKRNIAIVSACMTSNGTPALVINEVVASSEDIRIGIHYYLAEANLLEDGYEEPFVHFDEDESPAFLHAAVRQQSPSTNVIHPSEESACPASSN